MITIGQRQQLIIDYGLDITLNGRPAMLAGIRNEFASVIDAGTGLKCEFAWETVQHIVDNRNGEFHS